MFKRTLPLFLIAIFSLSACLAEIGPVPGQEQAGGESSGGGSDPTGGQNEDPLCTSTGESGANCEVTADCDAPLVCVSGTCMGPRNPDLTCDDIDGVECPGENQVCAAGLCVEQPGSCEASDECPVGYLCDGGQCAPERDGVACAAPGPGPNLDGTYRTVSHMHLREALGSTVDDVLGATETMRDLIEGNLDLGIPGWAEAILGSVVSQLIAYYVPSYATNLFVALGNFSDMVDDMKVESTMVVTGQPCSGTYRIEETWDWVTFDYLGQDMRFRADEIPGVPGGQSFTPDVYGGTYHCGQLYMDDHRIRDYMGGLIRFLLDQVANAATGYDTVEEAIDNSIDCPSVGQAISNYANQYCNLPLVCTSIDTIVTNACNGAKAIAINQLSQAIDDAAVKMSLISLKGVIDVTDSGQLDSGRLQGSFAGRDFPGEFEMEKN